MVTADRARGRCWWRGGNLCGEHGHPRTTGYRVLFYAARSATLALAFLWVPWMAVILFVFYLVKREMPYDLIP